MYTSTQIKNKINNLVTGAVNAGFDRTKLNAMVATLKTAVNNFYALDFDSYIEYDIEVLTHALIRSGIKYKDFTVSTATGNKPTGYDNVTEVFTVGSSMFNTSQATFNSSIVVVSDTSGSGESGVYQSNLVDTWLNEWLSAVTTVPANLELIAEYASDVGLISGVKIIYNPPEIISVPTVEELAKNVYTNHGYKEVIEKLGLSVYVPSYI